VTVSPHRSQKHLAFVRAQACMFCQRPAEEAHHAFRRAGGGGTGIKGCDLLAVPLCQSHHHELHATGTVRPYVASEVPVLLWRAAALTLRARLLEETCRKK
jgi:hypothetical protein